MFSATSITLGLLAGLIVGLSKTAIPGGGLLATPLLAMVVSGRLIAGTTIPILLVADVFAVKWFGASARRDLLRPLVAPVAIGFACGAVFFVVVGTGGRPLELTIGATVLLMAAIQLWRFVRNSPPLATNATLTGTVGISGGFTTFVSNAAGPILNTYFTGVGLEKREQIGTSAWFYFAVNVAKVPVYLAIGAWSSGGAFFTGESLLFDALVAPAVIVGVFGGRAALSRIPQRTFTLVVLVLAVAAAIRLIGGW